MLDNVEWFEIKGKFIENYGSRRCAVWEVATGCNDVLIGFVGGRRVSRFRLRFVSEQVNPMYLPTSNMSRNLSLTVPSGEAAVATGSTRVLGLVASDGSLVAPIHLGTAFRIKITTGVKSAKIL